MQMRLDKNNMSLGVVSSIAGVNRYDIHVVGEPNHAGSTMMEDRKDALVAAASFISKVPEVVKEQGNAFTVATVGTIKVILSCKAFLSFFINSFHQNCRSYPVRIILLARYPLGITASFSAGSWPGTVIHLSRYTQEGVSVLACP